MTKKRLLLALATALAAAGAAAQEPPLQGVLMTDEQHARQLASAEQWSALEPIAKKWLDDENANWESWYYYGLAQLRNGNPQQAVQTLSTALRLSPDRNDRLLLLLADSHTNLRDWKKAEQYYRDLLTLYPRNAEFWDKLRHVLEQRMIYEHGAPAVADGLIYTLKNLLEFGNFVKNDALWHRYATLLQAKAERGEEARRATGYYLRLRPDDLAALEWVFLYDLQNADDAVIEDSAKRLLRVAPQHPQVNLRYANIALAQGKRDRARDYYNIVAAHGAPLQKSEALTRLGELTKSTETGKALEYYQQAIRLDPANTQAWERIVVIYRSLGKTEDARRYFTRLRQVQQAQDAQRPIPPTVLEGL